MQTEVHIHEQRHDKGRGRQTVERQERRAEEFRRSARRGDALFGRSGQDCLDEIWKWTERERRKFCSGNGGEMKYFVVLPPFKFYVYEKNNFFLFGYYFSCL